MDGIICIYKEKGMTSFDVVAQVRRIYKTKKVGHGGTLDPMAEGVLPVFVGNATKAADFCPDDTKQYLAGFQFGITTDTQDITGKVLSTCDAYVSRNKMPMVERIFSGEQMQVPPMYSAVRVNGQRLYDLARKGEVVNRQPRKITVYEIKVTSYGYNSGEMSVTCSKGTYIRTLIHDIGQKLGTGAVMTSLVRTRSGVFKLEDCHRLSELNDKTEQELGALLIPLEKLYGQLPKAHLDEQQTKLFRNGAVLDADRIRFDVIYDKGYYIEGSDGVFLGLGRIGADHRLEVTRRFNTETAAAIEKAAKEQSYTPPPAVSESEVSKEKEFIPKRKNKEEKEAEAEAKEVSVSSNKAWEESAVLEIQPISEEDAVPDVIETAQQPDSGEAVSEEMIISTEEARSVIAEEEEARKISENIQEEEKKAVEKVIAESAVPDVIETAQQPDSGEAASEEMIISTEEARTAIAEEEEARKISEDIQEEGKKAVEQVIEESAVPDVIEIEQDPDSGEAVSEEMIISTEEARSVIAEEEGARKISENIQEEGKKSIEQVIAESAVPDVIEIEQDPDSGEAVSEEMIISTEEARTVIAEEEEARKISENIQEEEKKTVEQVIEESAVTEINDFFLEENAESSETESTIDEDYLAYLENALDFTDE